MISDSIYFTVTSISNCDKYQIKYFKLAQLHTYIKSLHLCSFPQLLIRILRYDLISILSTPLLITSFNFHPISIKPSIKSLLPQLRLPLFPSTVNNCSHSGGQWHNFTSKC